MIKTLRLQLRFLLPLCVVLLLAGYLAVPLVDNFTLRWFIRDLDMRSSLVADTLADPIARVMDDPTDTQIQTAFRRAIRDERLFALALCDDHDHFIEQSDGYPDRITCDLAREAAGSGKRMVALPRGNVHVSVIPVTSNTGREGQLVLLHDLSFIQRRSEDTRFYLILLIASLGAVIAFITMVVAHLSWRGWVSGVRAIMRGEGLLRPFSAAMPAPELQPLASDLRTMLRDLEDERRSRTAAGNEWTPARLRNLLQADLRGDEVIVVSNREPYIHSEGADGIVVKRPASGLVTAVEPVMRACSGTWIAHGSGSADRRTVDRHDHVGVPPDNPAYTLRRIWLSEEDEQGYYYGFANEGLWPLCHVAHVRPVFRQGDWERYKVVNQRFADAVVEEARTEDPVVLIQDYHFALVPRMIRERLPRATIITFWHIPWPNPESFGICPWQRELLRGMLGSTILGFHTPYHCKNFIETVDRVLEARIEHEHSTITVRGEQTLVESYPISIHWPSQEEVARRPAIADCQAELRARAGVPATQKIAVGVDRFDYTKGILERLHAVERMLEKHPELRGQFTLVQVAAPTRSSLEEYQSFQLRIHQVAARINDRFGEGRPPPVVLIAEQQDADTVTRFYRGSDVCVVTSLHDGMNLVAKEYVAARDDEQGVLLLSQFAGAARELHEALIVNPYHVEETADALYRGLTMAPAEQMERMRSLRTIVREYNVYRWAGLMLMDAARLRRRERIAARVELRSEE